VLLYGQAWALAENQWESYLTFLLRVFMKYSIKKWQLVKFWYAAGGQKQSSASVPSSVKNSALSTREKISKCLRKS
jgi:hypothetical protein